MALDKRVQEVLLGRLDQLSKEEILAFDQGIDQNAALVMLYKLVPEIDFVLMQGLTALEGHQYQPELVLNGEGVQQTLPPQGPQPQPQPQQMQPQPQQQAPLGALGGINAGPSSNFG